MAVKPANRSARKSPRDIAAAEARARLAKRAKRTKFYRENKRRIVLLFLGGLTLLILAVFTPIGPDMYYNNIQNRKFSSPGALGTGVLNDLYKLGRFYGLTFRAEKANGCYDEIGKMYYGFTFTEYSQNPDEAMDRRFEAQRLKDRGEGKGPPYAVSPGDLTAVGEALYQIADWNRSFRPRQFARRLFELYVEDFYKDHPSACHPDTTRQAKLAFDRLSGK